MNYNRKKMISTRNLLYSLALVSIISFCCINQSFGQEKVNISAGLGLPELLNVGIRYQLKQTQIGIGLGFIPREEENAISVSGDVFYHFSGLSEFSKRRTWYGRFGLNYLREEDETLVEKYLFLNLRIGKDFNISRKFGIQIDAGLIFQLFNEEIRKVPTSGWDVGPDFDSAVLPSFGIGLFYRI